MGIRLRISAAVIGLALVVAPVSGQDQDLLQETIRENTTKLSNLRSRIRRQQERMTSIKQEADQVRRSHAEIQQEIAESQQLMNDLVQSELELMAQSTQLAGEVEKRRLSYRNQKQTLARSLRNMYLREQRNEMEVVLTAQNFSDLMTRMKVSRMMARLEAGVVEQTRREGARILLEQRVLDAALAEIWQTREEKRGENDRLELLLAEQMAALRELEIEQKGIKNSMLEYSLSEQKLNFILEELDQQQAEKSAQQGPDTMTTLVAMAGQLEWPVQGELVRGFGRSVHPRFKTVTLNNGFNIAAPVGAPVAAVAPGVVEFSDHLPGFGQCVILDHGAGYYTLYAHLERVFVANDEEIAQGQVVAEVGRPTGGEDPQLYFEVRQGRTPLDPGNWLKTR